MQRDRLSGQFTKFYSDGYKIGMEAVSRGLSDEALNRATEQLYRNVDGLINSLLGYAKKNDTKVYCRKGCSCCCYQPAYALTHEILYLKKYIHDKFKKSEQEEVLERAFIREQKVGRLSKDALLNSKHACPLLKGGICTAYEARPMSCRIYLSLDIRSCKDFYLNPDSQSGFPKIMEFPLQAGRMMNEGFKAALKQSGGMSEEYRIEEGLIKYSLT